MTTWVLLRAAGIGSYLMLFLSVAWGLIATTSLVTKRISKPTANMFHAFVASAGFALLGVHLGLLLVDGFMPFSLLALTVPMASEYSPVAVTAGIISMYAIVIVVVVTSWLRTSIGTVSWRRLHVLARARPHPGGRRVFTGTDTGARRSSGSTPSPACSWCSSPSSRH